MKKKVLLLMLVCCVFMGQVKMNIVRGESTITERKFIVLLMTNMKFCKEEDSVSSIVNEAVKKKIIKKTEKGCLSNSLTKERAAVYLNRMDVKMNGPVYDKEMYKNVLELHRISDLNSMKKSSRASVIKMFCKGIMVGYHNGYYIQSRKFRGTEKVSLTEAKTYIKRLQKQNKRKKMSPDGQLIRETKLPSNAKSYPYILTAYPNSFYEKSFEYQKTKYHKKPVPLQDFASPAQVGSMTFYNGITMETVKKQYLLDWCKKVETNMKLRFNVDYRTINTTWIHQLRKTYYVFDDAQTNKSRTDDIKAYVQKAKKNKVVVKTSRVTVEPSTLYNSGLDYVRVYVRYKVVSGEGKGRDLIYCDKSDVKFMREEKWMEQCFDIALGSFNGNSYGEDFSVINNSLLHA
ncbi:hypothetical protein [[Clostridium] polysaccharolyticum]|uniref:SLH domain-containing protein n=1 Tax=[Clostridium] polysaccharolyticum TaxID=29364 RepID=A0A1H9ZPN9_9FIRM|nr:hypothetical protein [[Clostridium] polysaccharolyticum]SES83614.1 hypothetical protein SAMN04487772_10445 [[Clostridium] polysaccharolyticum]